MDETDRRILEYLQEDGRAAYTDIAEALGVSEGTVRNRVRQLQEDGTIERFTVEVADTDQIAAVVMVEVNPDREIADIIDAFPENSEIHEVTGNWDLIGRFAQDTSSDLNETLEDIRKIDGVTQTQTYTVLQSHRR